MFNSWTDGINPATSQLKAIISDVSTSAGTNAGTFKATVTFQLTKNGLPYGVPPAQLKQKTMYFVSYDGAGKFPTAPYVETIANDPTGSDKGTVPGDPTNFSFTGMALTDAATGTYTMARDNLTADPLDAAVNANSFVYGYFGDTLVIPAAGHYNLMDNMVSVAQVINGTIAYTSTANATGCQKCHAAPYSKHGYRQATVAGLNDFVACKACHTDSRRGTDGSWHLLVDDRAAFANQQCLGAETVECLTADQLQKYFYVANVMQDTHASHAKEFEYPQSMANCTACHAGKLERILTDANFQLTTCTSCHPVTGVGGTDAKRAPALKDVLPAAIHGTFDLYNYTGQCNSCHVTGNPMGAKLFKDIHTGYDKIIYDSAGAKYSASIKTQVDQATFDAATNKLTVKFSVTGAAANAIVKPMVVVSLYGYSSKDFLVSGHGSQPAPDGKRNLEYTEGSTSNSPRLTVAPATTPAGTTSWTATADLTLWASKLADKSVKKLELAVLPALGLVQTKAPDNAATLTTGTVNGVACTAAAPCANPNYNPYIAIAGTNRTFDLVAKALQPVVAQTATIVSADKCNACHEALGTTFHSPTYGSSGVVTCRLCHTVQSGGSHLEMQSRSIDSYVHAIHTFQAFDINSFDFAKPVDALDYALIIEATYPQFTTLSCESCHNTGTYDVPDQSKSMPGLHSKSSTITGKTRAINNVPEYVTGPGSRACGGCHRAELIKEDDAGGLAAFNQHAAAGGYMLVNGTGVLDATTAKIMSLFP